MPKPLIAVGCYHLALGRVTRWDTGAYAVPDEYVAAVERAGARAALLAGTPDDDAEAFLTRFDALLLVGGGDVDPDRYGDIARHLQLYGMNAERDRMEVGLVLAADRLRMPTLAICRGIQVMNVAFGGTLHQHLPDVEAFADHRRPAGEGFLHEVKVLESSRLAEATGSAALRCYSAHHQGLDRLAEGLTATGWAEDGLVEAAERPEGWVVGVQWHPEHTAADDPTQQALFDALVRRARKA